MTHLFKTIVRTSRARRAGARILSLVTLVLVGVLAAGCGAGRAFGRGDSAARAGDWDAAVEHYRRAVQQDPERADYQIALERAMINASIQHLDQARLFEARGQIEDALREALARRRAGAARPRLRLRTFKGLGLQPGVNLDRDAALLDLIEGVD